ncbi:MAG: hypothetical protein ACYC27_10755 [Armatimonadota bacterium]
MLNDFSSSRQHNTISENDDTDINFIIDLLSGKDEHAGEMMPGWDIELACQKLLFFTTPREFTAKLTAVRQKLDSVFQISDTCARVKSFTFLINITESLYSIVELKHNLCNTALHGDDILGNDSISLCIDESRSLLSEWESLAPDAAKSVLDSIKLEDIAVNKGDNIFIAWANRWESENGVDPYLSIYNYLDCFKSLYNPDNYYISLFLAWEDGDTATQFFNDYGLQAARCRRLGSLGGTTNPAIAVMGENDLNADGNIHGESAIQFIRSRSNKWHIIRERIAEKQLVIGESDEWGASAFTEWVVCDAMLALRPLFLLKGLGRVAYQLRPDWHLDEEKLIYGAGSVYQTLCSRVKVLDDILLNGADDLYLNLCRQRIDKPNNHFKIACTSQVALNVVKALNAGYHPNFPDAINDRMFTNMTLVYDVPQMVAASLAIEKGIAEYTARTGETVDDGQGGSAVASMIGRFNDAIRSYRVHALLDALPVDSVFKSIDTSSIKSLDSPPLNTPEFLREITAASVEFDPHTEEDAIDHAGTLTTKNAVTCLHRKYGLHRTRILTASKRNFNQNTDLLGVAYSTDFGNIQRMSLDLSEPCKDIVCRQTIYDDMNPDGTPVSGSVWDRRSQTLARIWPGWLKAFDPNGLHPDEYLDTIYVPPTLNQFTGFWIENVSRAAMFRAVAESEEIG